MKNIKKFSITLLFIICMLFSIINTAPASPDNPPGITPEETIETDETTNEITPLHDNTPPGIGG